jgi:nitrogen regulatory protein PII 2
MKEIIALIRPSQAFITKKNLQSDGFPAYTSFRVLGRSRQRGLRYAPRPFFFWRKKSDKIDVQFVPKVYISLIVADRDLNLAVQSLIRSNQTGKIGDGKIFVLPVEEAIQIRNQIKGDRCLQ